MEITLTFIKNHKFINRGFMLGPVVPIYGTGAVLITIFLSKYSNNIFIIFFMTIIIGGILEYFISYAMEKIFKIRWWDYRTSKYNINGRICLENLLSFGILGVIVIKYTNPYFLNTFDNLPENIILISTCVISFIFIIDYIISFTIVYNLKLATKNIYKDSTEEIKKLIKDTFINNKILYNRIIKAFPNIYKINNQKKKQSKK